MRHLWAPLALTLATSCVPTSNEGIPCSDYNDLQCPTGYWCDKFDCQSLETAPPPDLDIIGLATGLTYDEAEDAPDSAFAKSIVIDRESATIHVRIQNRSTGEAAYPVFDVALPCCAGGNTTFGAHLIGIIRSNAAATDDFSVRGWASGCQKTDFTISTTVRGRTFSQNFEMEFVEPTERSIAERTCE